MRHSREVADRWHAAVATIGNHFLKMQGLEVGPCDIVLHVRPCEGLVRQLDGSVEKRWAPKELACPIQVRLKSVFQDCLFWLVCASRTAASGKRWTRPRSWPARSRCVHAHVQRASAAVPA